MSPQKSIFVGIITAVFIALGAAASVFADSITVGGTSFDISEQVTGVTCDDTTSPAGVSCSIETASGSTKDVQFGANHDSAWYQTQVTTELTNAGLMSANPSTPDNPDSSGTGSQCTSILPSSWCSEDGGSGVVEILNLVLNILTLGMGILATIGLVISGIQWLTARDKEENVVKAKSRIFNIVIGLVVWGIMWLLLSWLLPGGINLTL